MLKEKFMDGMEHISVRPELPSFFGYEEGSQTFPYTHGLCLHPV